MNKHIVMLGTLMVALIASACAELGTCTCTCTIDGAGSRTFELSELYTEGGCEDAADLGSGNECGEIRGKASCTSRWSPE